MSPSNEPMDDEEWERRRAWIREGVQQWKLDHPEEVEAARREQKREWLKAELSKSKTHESRLAEEAYNRRHSGISISLYLGSIVLLGWLLSDIDFHGLLYGGPGARWWKLLLVFGIAAWGIGGIVACHSIADRLCGPRGDH